MTRQRGQPFQGFEHLRRGSLEQAATADAEQRISAEKQVLTVVGNVTAGVAGHGDDLEPAGRKCNLDPVTVVDAVRGDSDAFVARRVDLDRFARTESGNAADVIGMVVGQQDRAQAKVPIVQHCLQGCGLAGIHRQGVAFAVGEQPDVVVVQGRNRPKSHGFHGGHYSASGGMSGRSMARKVAEPDGLAAAAASGISRGRTTFPGWAKTSRIERVKLAGRWISPVQPTGKLRAVHLVPRSIFELVELQHLLAGEWNLARARAALVASGPGLSIDPLAVGQARAISSHPEWTRLHRHGNGLAGDLRCLPDSLPFENDSMQLIVARHIVDVLGPGSGIEAELARILAPGGMLFLFGLNPLSPWRFWLSRQVRHGLLLPDYSSSGRVRSALVGCKLSIVRREFLGGAWPGNSRDASLTDSGPAGAIWEGAWLLAARKQRVGMRPIPLRAGRRRVPVNSALAQSPSRRVSP